MDEVINRCDRRLKAEPERPRRHVLQGRAPWPSAAACTPTASAGCKRGPRRPEGAPAICRRSASATRRTPTCCWASACSTTWRTWCRSKHPFLKPFTRFFPRGAASGGSRRSSQAVEKGQFVSTEAAFCLVQIYYVFEHDYATSLHYARWLRDRYPNNSLFHIYEGRAFARLNLWDDARRTLREVHGAPGGGKPGYRGDVAEQALFLLCRDAVRCRQYAEALDILDRLERMPETGRNGREESVYKTLGRLYRGMALDAQGQRDKALFWYREVRSAKGPDSARDMAKNYLKAPYSPG